MEHAMHHTLTSLLAQEHINTLRNETRRLHAEGRPPRPTRRRLVRVARSRAGLVRGAAVAALLILSASAGALSATGATIVPPNGKVAGEGYAFFLQKFWQTVFGATAPGPNPCETVSANGQQVGYLAPQTGRPGTYHYACTEPAGRPIYVVGLSNECSTVKGDHGKFGTTQADLEHCARAEFAGATATASIDGRAVPHYQRLLAATDVYPFTLANGNVFTVPPMSGTSAAYGYGMLLTGLGRGAHTIASSGDVPSAKYRVKVVYKVTVR
jgi:hypothetical protein